MNFRYDTERPFITQYFEPSQELVEKFSRGFKDTEHLEDALSDLFWARAENNLEDYIRLDERQEPDTSICSWIWMKIELEELFEKVNSYAATEN